MRPRARSQVSASAIAREALEMLSGVDPLGVRPTVDGHRESFPARVGHPAYDGLEVGRAVFGFLSPVDGGVEGASEPVLVVVVSAFETDQSSNVGIDGRLLQHEGVAGRQCLDLKLAGRGSLRLTHPLRRRPPLPDNGAPCPDPPRP